jgi:hypothetical protein
MVDCREYSCMSYLPDRNHLLVIILSRGRDDSPALSYTGRQRSKGVVTSQMLNSD